MSIVEIYVAVTFCRESMSFALLWSMIYKPQIVYKSVLPSSED